MTVSPKPNRYVTQRATEPIGPWLAPAAGGWCLMWGVKTIGFLHASVIQGLVRRGECVPLVAAEPATPVDPDAV